MRSLRLVALAAGIALALSVAVAPTVVGGNSDAAHACQQGGYTTLQGTDGTRFTNTGQCVAFVARGGTITGISASCAYTPGVTGCIEFDNVLVYLGTDGAISTSWTSLSGMFSFAPVTSWSPTTLVTVTGSGTWLTSTGLAGTWTATTRSSIYPTTFFDSATVTFTTCAAADTRSVGVHFDLAGGGLPANAAIEIGVRLATSGTNFVQYQGFTGMSAEPAGIHTTTDMSGVTLRC